MAHSFFGGGSYAIIAPYMAEVWPAGSRERHGLGYGVGNFRKIISRWDWRLVELTAAMVRDDAVAASARAPLVIRWYPARAEFVFGVRGIMVKLIW